MALWALASRQWRVLWRFLHPAGIFAFALAALPWYIICSLRNPDFFRTFILLHNFQRYLTPVFQHRQPFWFFVPITILALLPLVRALQGLGMPAGGQRVRNGDG